MRLIVADKNSQIAFGYNSNYMAQKQLQNIIKYYIRSLVIVMNINIFQFLKQGTSLNKKSMNQNSKLQEQIIFHKKQQNYDMIKCGKFNESDSQDQQPPKSNKKQVIQKFNYKKNQKNKQLASKLAIKCEGLDYPSICSNFTKIIKKYKISENLIHGIQELGFRKPTAVQTQVIPCLLENRNVIVTAPTGTGKTLSFLLPILQHIKQKQSRKIIAIIMTPLQQLANQIVQQLSLLSKFKQVTYKCITKMTQQQKIKIKANKSPGFNIMVTTPMSFLNIFQNHKNIMKSVQYIVLDQCDKYFEQSFLDQIKRFLTIFQNYHPIYALFSATIQHPVQELLKTELLHDCVRIQVGGKNKVLQKIKQSIQYCTNQYGKIVYLKNLILQGGFVPPALIFVQEKIRAKQLYYQVKKILKNTIGGVRKIQLLSGEKNKQQRQQIINNFDNGHYWALITTDIIARGIDFKNVNLVINYDFPNSILTYIHRVGRTGRAERNGSAITFFTDQDKLMVRSLANLLKVSGCPVPEWICQMKKASRTIIKKRQKYPTKRLPVGVSSGKDKNWQKQVQISQKKWQKLHKKQLNREDQAIQQEDNNQWIQVGPNDGLPSDD